MYKCNNLGKSVLIDDQINSAYDNVEYVAKHLPLMADLMSKIEVLKAFEPIMNMLAHMQNTDIHLSEEQVNQINKITEILADLDNKANDITSIWNDICDINQSLSNHFNNNSIHVSPEDREKWDNYATQISQIINNNLDLEDSLAKVATTGSYNDLRDKPVLQNITVDNALSVDSHNPVENQVLTNKLLDKVDRDVLHRVAFSGRYADLQGVPTGDTQLNPSSTNWLTNQCVTEAIEDLSNNLETRAYTKTETDTLLLGKSNVGHTHSYNDLTNKPTIPTVNNGILTINVNGDTAGTFSANQGTDETINITVPDANNGTLTIQQNGTTVDTFTANSSTDKTVNISVPTKTSDLTNDSGFITGVTWNDISNKPTLATVATSGSYNDLTDKPIIPDAANYYTKEEVYTLISNIVSVSVQEVHTMKVLSDDVSASIRVIEDDTDTSVANYSTVEQAGDVDVL